MKMKVIYVIFFIDFTTKPFFICQGSTFFFSAIKGFQNKIEKTRNFIGQK